MPRRSSLRKTILHNTIHKRNIWLFDELCWCTWVQESGRTDAAPDVYKSSFARTLKQNNNDYKTYYLNNIEFIFSGLVVRTAAYRIGGILCSECKMEPRIN